MKAYRFQPHTGFRVASLLALILSGYVGSAVAQSPKKVPSGDPCTVVPLADVQKAFPGAKPGVRKHAGRSPKEEQDQRVSHVHGV